MIAQTRILAEHFFISLGVTSATATTIAQIAVVLALLLVSLLLAWGLNKVLVPLVLKIVATTKTRWDDYLVNLPVLKAVCRLLPSILVYNLLPLCFDGHNGLTFTIIYQLTQVYIAFSCVMLLSAFLKNITTVAIEELEEHHLVGILQFLQVLTYCLGGIIMVSLLCGYNPTRVIAGLGAAATVLMLVFKDTLLGLVAGIQLSANGMLKVNDWITLPKLHINGFVESMSLTTIKVRNFDNTISTVPPYTLVSDSFQNWSGMQAAGCRRVKRALYIDINSIHFADRECREMLVRKKLASKSCLEAERTTNLTLFRHYLSRRLADDGKVSDKQWRLIRQLEPTPNGLPLEVWFYFNETAFVRFEELASTYMEEMIASLPLFELRAFQSPTGADLSVLRS